MLLKTSNNGLKHTANIYDGITMELQRIIVLVRYYAVGFNYSGKYGRFLYEIVNIMIKKRAEYNI